MDKTPLNKGEFLFDFPFKKWNNQLNMEWDKLSEKVLLKLLPLFLIIKSVKVIWGDLREWLSQSSK